MTTLTLPEQAVAAVNASLAKRMSVSERANALTEQVQLLVGKAYNPNQPRDDVGRWTASGGSSGTMNMSTDAGLPYSRQIREARSFLEGRQRDLDAMRRTGTDTSDDDYKSTVLDIKETDALIQELERKQKAQLGQTATPRVYIPTKPEPAKPSQPNQPGRGQDNFSQMQEAQRRADERRREAWRLQQQGQQRQQSQQRLSMSPDVRSVVTDPVYSPETPTGVVDAAAVTAARVARTAARVSAIAAAVHSAANTTDYVQIGRSLNEVRGLTRELKSELKQLPGDVRVLRTETVASLSRMQAAADKLQSKLKTKAKAGGARAANTSLGRRVSSAVSSVAGGATSMAQSVRDRANRFLGRS